MKDIREAMAGLKNETDSRTALVKLKEDRKDSTESLGEGEYDRGQQGGLDERHEDTREVLWKI